MKHLASAQLFVTGFAFSYKSCKDFTRDNALVFAKLLVGSKVRGVRVVVPVVPAISAVVNALPEIGDRGSPRGGIVLFETVDSHRSRLGSKGSATIFAVLAIPSLEVEEVRHGNPVTRARREEPQRSLFGFKNSLGGRKELPNEPQHREAIYIYIIYILWL